MTNEPTFGERAVGYSFNPEGHASVQDIKKVFADLIYTLEKYRNEVKVQEDDGQNGERLRMLSIAITEAQTAQMWGVKAVTWK